MSLQSDIAKVDLLYSKFTNYCFLQEEERRKTKELLEEEERRKGLQVNNYVATLRGRSTVALKYTLSRFGDSTELSSTQLSSARLN